MVSCCLALQNYLVRPVGGVKELKLPSHSPGRTIGEAESALFYHAGYGLCVGGGEAHVVCLRSAGRAGTVELLGGGAALWKVPVSHGAFQAAPGETRVVVVVKL